MSQALKKSIKEQQFPIVLLSHSIIYTHYKVSLPYSSFFRFPAENTAQNSIPKCKYIIQHMLLLTLYNLRITFMHSCTNLVCRCRLPPYNATNSSLKLTLKKLKWYLKSTSSAFLSAMEPRERTGKRNHII